MPKPSSTSLAVELTPQAVTARIVTLRGVQVLFDRDLAQFFEVQPIRLREQVKRNIARFPADFMFQLTPDEVAAMVSQNAIPSKQQLGGYLKLLPLPKTEQGKQTPMIQSVSRIMVIKEKDPAADTSALEREIDQQVYALYGLTPEEIATVEGTAK